MSIEEKVGKQEGMFRGWSGLASGGTLRSKDVGSQVAKREDQVREDCFLVRFPDTCATAMLFLITSLRVYHMWGSHHFAFAITFHGPQCLYHSHLQSPMGPYYKLYSPVGPQLQLLQMAAKCDLCFYFSYFVLHNCLFMFPPT